LKFAGVVCKNELDYKQYIFVSQMDKSVINTDIQNLYGGIAELIKQAKTRVAVTINAELAMLNWQIGKYIKSVYSTRQPRCIRETDHCQFICSAYR